MNTHDLSNSQLLKELADRNTVFEFTEFKFGVAVFSAIVDDKLITLNIDIEVVFGEYADASFGNQVQISDFLDLEDFDIKRLDENPYIWVR